MKYLQLIPSLIFLLFIFSKEAHMSTYGGVDFYGKYVRVWNVIIAGNTRDGGAELAEVERREKETKPIIDALGKDLDAYIRKLMSAKSPWPWLRASLKTYPRNESGSGCQESFDLDAFRFDSIHVAVWAKDDEPWLPLGTLVHSLVKQWLWQTRELNNGSDNPEHLKWMFAELKEKGPDWIGSSFVNLKLPDNYVAELKNYAAGDDLMRRQLAIEALSQGNYITDPAWFEPLLADPDKLIREFAMRGLFLIPERGGEKVLAANIDKISDFFEEKELQGLKKYLGVK